MKKPKGYETDAAGAVEIDTPYGRPRAAPRGSPIVACENCQHFIRNPRNPRQGAGSCAIRADVNSVSPYDTISGRAMSCYPGAPRYCDKFSQKPQEGEP